MLFHSLHYAHTIYGQGLHMLWLNTCMEIRPKSLLSSWAVGYLTRCKCPALGGESPASFSVVQLSSPHVLGSSYTRHGSSDLVRENGRDKFVGFRKLEFIRRLRRLRKGKFVGFAMGVRCRKGGGFPTLDPFTKHKEGASCVYVGPLESAEKERLEALYQQCKHCKNF
eukprot:c23071_g1_i3 orf=480-983(-)